MVNPTGVWSLSDFIIIPSRTLKRILGQIPHSFEISSTVPHVKVLGPWQTYTTHCCGWCPPGFTWCSVQSLARVSCRVMAPVSGAFGGNIVPGCTLLTWDPGVWLSSARPRRTRQKLLAPDQEMESGVCVPELSGSCQAAASQHTPSCRQLSQGENSQQSRRLTGPGREGGLARLWAQDYGAKSKVEVW